MDLIEEIKSWIFCLDPKKFKELMAREKGKKDLIAASRRIVISFLVMAIPMGLLMILFGLMLGSKAPSYFGLPLPVLAVLYVIVMVVLAPLSFLLTQGVYWIIAKVLGGKGAYREQAYLASFFTAGIYVLSLLGIVPCLGSIVSIALMILLFYLQYLVIVAVHKISGLRAVAVVLAPIAVFLLMYVLLILYLTPVMVASGPVQVQ